MNNSDNSRSFCQETSYNISCQMTYSQGHMVNVYMLPYLRELICSNNIDFADDFIGVTENSRLKSKYFNTNSYKKDILILYISTL